LSDEADRQLKTYSGGMKRRVGIAQALLGDPQLLIVDEPTAGLDPEERVRLRNLLSDMAARRTVTPSSQWSLSSRGNPIRRNGNAAKSPRPSR